MGGVGQSIESGLMVHNFAQSLALSHEHADAPWWGIVYRRAFANQGLVMQCVRNDGWAQRGGIDRIVTLTNGRVIRIDEKVRAQDWPDILLERWSDREREKPGWIQKPLACDYIAYAFIPSETCYLLPTLQLQQAWRLNRVKWVRAYKPILAANEGYTTESIPVPIEELMTAITNAMRVCWAQNEAA